MQKIPTVGERFAGFALGHFALCLISLAAICLYFMVARLDSEWLVYVLPPLLMLAYFPAGYWVAKTKGWARSGWKTGALAVLLPALIAWAWEGLVLCGALSLLWVAVVLAGPSLCNAFLGMILLAELPPAVFMGASGLWVFGLLVFLLGFLPPLLFHIGALLAEKPLTTEEIVVN